MNVVVADPAGNSGLYSSLMLSSLGFDDHVRVSSHVDRKGPTLAGFSLGPHAVDKPAARKAVRLDPDHTLDVTDLAGNPFDQTQLYFKTHFDT